MKRKMIMQLPAEKPGKEIAGKKKAVTVQWAENILILDYFGDGEWIARHCLNTKTNEYETYHVKDGIWNQNNVTSLYSDNCAYWRSGYSMYKCVGVSSKDKKLAMEALGTKRENIFEEIEYRERDRNQMQRDRKINRKKERVKQLMDSLPPLPMAIRVDWGWEAIGYKKHYAFYDKENRVWNRTCCKERTARLERTDGGAKIRHNDQVRCSACKSILTAKKRVESIEAESRVMVLQRVDSEKSVACHMKVSVQWSKEGIKTYVNEEVRIILHNGVAPNCDIYYAQDSDWGWNRWSDMDWWTSNSKNKRTGRCLLYPYGVNEALKGTGYAKWADLFTQMAEDNITLDYNRLMAGNTGKNAVEYLYKGRFWRLLEETIAHIGMSGHYWGNINLNGQNEREVFGIRDRQKILRIRQEDGGENYVAWMRFSERMGVKINSETMDWLEQNRIDPGDIGFISDRMTPQQIKNYVEKQKTVSYPDMDAPAILRQWDDYLLMGRVAGKDLYDEMVYRPRELKRRHDEMIIYQQKARIVEDMEKDPEKSKKYADEMAEKYPGAEENLKAVKEKYGYQNGEYLVIVPDRLVDIVKEGNALHHCAGSSERYFERIMSRETYICFLRREEEPEIPFYTIEIEPNGTIRQHRSYLDEEPGIEEIRGFLKEWQQVVKKRIKKEDLELQKISEEKREKNLQELREKNNTRVLEGLMEDFMEAV